MTKNFEANEETTKQQLKHRKFLKFITLKCKPQETQKPITIQKTAIIIT